MRWGAAFGCWVLAGCTFGSTGGSGGDSGVDETTGSGPATTTGPVATSALDTTSAGSAGSASTSGVATSSPGTDSSSGPSSDSSDSSTSGGDSSSGTGVATCETMPPWWNDAWGRRRPISFDTSSVMADQTDVPVRIRLDAGRIDYAAVEDQGVDLRFVGSDQMTELDYEVEHWDEAGESEVWLRVPLVPGPIVATPLQVWMYYDNPAAAPGEAPTAVWDGDFVSVHHFADFDDATGNGHTGVGPNLPSDADGQIGRARSFDGNDDQVELMHEAAYDLTTGLTVEAWISVDSFTDEWQSIVTKGDDTYRLHRQGTSAFVGFGSDTESSSNDNLSGTTPVDNGDWFYVAIVYENGTKRIYVDGGEDVSQGYPGPLRETDAPLWVGNNAETADRFFHGRIDEVRISSIGRSAEWMALQDASMRDNLISVGAEQLCR